MFGGPPRGPPQKGQGAGRPPLLDLPPNLRMMFEPLAPVEFKPPVQKREMPPYSGISASLSLFEKDPPPKPKPFETPIERKQKMKAKMLQLHTEKIEILVNDWDPHSNSKATELSYETNEKKLRREFEQYGPIRSIRLISDSDGKSRGYAFIEFENEADMTNAYRKTNGKKLDGRRIVCDVERGRTVRNWRPMRFGGGLGGRINRTKKEEGNAAATIAPASSNSNSNPSSDDRNHGSSQHERRTEVGKNRSRSRDGRYRENNSNRDRERGNSRDRGGRGGGSETTGIRAGRERSRSRDRGSGTAGSNNGMRDRRDTSSAVASSSGYAGGEGGRVSGAPRYSSNQYSYSTAASNVAHSGYTSNNYRTTASSSATANGSGGGGGGGYDHRDHRARSRDRR